MSTSSTNINKYIMSNIAIKISLIMNLQSLCFVLLTLILFIFMVYISLITISKISGSMLKLPPGPSKLPIIGSLHHLIGALPHRKFRELANKFGPIMYLKLGQLPMIVISSPELAKEVMNTNDVNFANRPRSFSSQMVVYDFDDIMLSPYGEFWRNLRKICVRDLLSVKRVQSFEPIREEEMFRLVERISSNVGSIINLSEMIKCSIRRITSQFTFGRDEDLFAHIVEESSLLAARFHVPEFFPRLGFLGRGTGEKCERLRRKADKLLEGIIEGHRMRKRGEREEDLVDVLLKFHDDHKDNLGFSLTIHNIKAIIWDIISAGSKSSITTTDWAMVEMMKNPRVMKITQQEVRKVFGKKGSIDEQGIEETTYLKCVVKETLRLHSPVALIPKEGLETREIGGYEIPAKTRVMVNLWAISREPRFWTDQPESFVPERFLDSCVDFKGRDFEFIPFGAGRRICPGISLGVTSVEIQLAFLLYHFDWKLPDGMSYEDLDMSESYGLTVKRKRDLHLIPFAYDLSTIGKNSK